MSDGRGSAVTCVKGHEKTGTRLQRGKQILYCVQCSKEYRERHLQKCGPRVRLACRYGHPLPQPLNGVARRTCDECARIARVAKERASVSA